MRNLISLSILSTLPVLLLLLYFWKRDRGTKEPPALMRKVFFHGILIVIPVGILEYFSLQTLNSFGIVQGSAAYGFIVPFFIAGLIEEAAKLHVVKKYAYNDPAFNEKMDGITYCILASMGFALFENVMYTFFYGSTVSIMRFFTAVPAHALFSGLMGYYIGKAKFSRNREEEQDLIYRGLYYGIFFHGLYDFLLISGVPILMFSIFPLLIFMWRKLNREINSVQSPKLKT